MQTAVLIFAEHNKLSQQVPLLKKQITNLELSTKEYEKIDSIRVQKLAEYEQTINRQNNSIEKLNKSLKTNKKIITYGSLGATILIVIGFLK